MIIYLDDQKFIQTVTVIYNTSLPLHNTVNSLLLTLEDTSVKHKNLITKLEKYTSDNTAKLVKKEFEKINKDRDKAFKKFNEKYDEIKEGVIKNQKHLVHVYKKRILMDYGITK